ncbi:MAG: hypothetical protein ACOCZ9_02980, partial [Spirochaetota bacterium]
MSREGGVALFVRQAFDRSWPRALSGTSGWKDTRAAEEMASYTQRSEACTEGGYRHSPVRSVARKVPSAASRVRLAEIVSGNKSDNAIITRSQLKAPLEHSRVL